MIDNLYKEVEKLGPICVGLDTDLNYLPKKIKSRNNHISDMLFDFNKSVIDSTIDLVPTYKVQIAYYERYGIEGLIAYKRTLEYLKYSNSISIADVKRGDIAASAQMYAKAHFEGDFEADMLTVSPYMGYETLDHFLEYLDKGKSIFVLLRTSNDGAKDIQYKESEDKYIYNHIGDKLQKIASSYKGSSGYSNLGLVVGAKDKIDANEIRNRYNDLYFLIPGYGYQGGTGEDIRLYLNDLNGGIVNSSRGILLNYKKHDDGEEKFEKYTREAVLNMKKDILG